MAVPFTRRMIRGTRGRDVEAVGRALSRANVSLPLIIFNRLPTKVRQYYGLRKVKAIKKFQRHHGLPATGVYNLVTHKKLEPYFDKYAAQLMRTYKPDPHEIAWNKLLKSMETLSKYTPGYIYGGGHGQLLRDISPHQGLDCSSSTSKALFDAGLFPHDYAWVSGDFEHYGEPGPGKYFTIYANSEHVWTRLNKSRRWWRFDTSPHGDGGRGPHLRFWPRYTSTFVARHYPGM